MPENDFSVIPDPITGMFEAMDILTISRQMMPGTRAFNGRMIIQAEIKKVTATAEVMKMIIAGIQDKYPSQVWDLRAAQSTFKEKQYDVNDDPVMVDDGEGNMIHLEQVNVFKAASTAQLIDFMPDIPDTIDGEGNVLTWKRPTTLTLSKHVGAEPFEIVA